MNLYTDRELRGVHVLWLAHDEVALFGLPRLLDQVTNVSRYRVIADISNFRCRLDAEPFDVCVVPLRFCSREVVDLVADSRARLIISTSSPNGAARYRAAGGVADGWVLEQDISADGIFGTFDQCCGPGVDAAAPVSVRNSEPGYLASKLTDRERQVLIRLAEGQSNQQIARGLDISIHGAKRHISNLLLKFDCKNRTEIALKATQLGIV